MEQPWFSNEITHRGFVFTAFSNSSATVSSAPSTTVATTSISQSSESSTIGSTQNSAFITLFHSTQLSSQTATITQKTLITSDFRTPLFTNSSIKSTSASSLVRGTSNTTQSGAKSTVPSDYQESQQQGAKNSTIVGSVIGTVAGITLAAFIILYLLQNNKRNRLAVDPFLDADYEPVDAYLTVTNGGRYVAVNDELSDMHRSTEEDCRLTNNHNALNSTAASYFAEVESI